MATEDSPGEHVDDESHETELIEDFDDLDQLSDELTAVLNSMLSRGTADDIVTGPEDSTITATSWPSGVDLPAATDVGYETEVLGDLDDNQVKDRKPAPEPGYTMHVALLGVLVTVVIVLVGAGVLIAFDKLSPTEFGDLAPAILAPLFTLAGTGLAFYRSERRH